jgi:hypothetical protein
LVFQYCGRVSFVEDLLCPMRTLRDVRAISGTNARSGFLPRAGPGDMQAEGAVLEVLYQPENE